jgi:Flp pilus assembly protein TadG
MGCELRRARGDGGVVVVLIAAVIAAVLVVASLVIDLGGARNAREHDQDSADAMALAGAAKLDPTAGNNQAACMAAWNYAISNLGVAASPAPSCVTMAGTCSASTAREVSVTRGDFVFTLVNPVPDGYDVFDDQPVATSDSTPCNRFAVKISHTWRHLLQRGETALAVSAVAKFVHDPGNVDAPLVVLDPHACEALSVTGSSHVTTHTSTGALGYVAIDSDGAECTSGKRVVVDTTGSAQITAGAIAMWALTTGNTARAYDPSDVGPGQGFDPAPIAASAPVGRSAVDWRYNCNTANGCPNASAATIDDLVAAEGSGTPAGFTRWTSVYSCSLTTNLVVPPGNWYIDCPSGLSTSGVLTFRGGDIVSAGGFNLTGNGALRVNCDVASSATACPSDPATPSTLFIRSGGLDKSGNVSMTLLETAVYVAGGTVNLTGTGTLTWTAPNDPASPLDDLLLWSESSSTMTMTGNTDTTLEGIFFAPNAPLALTGNTSAAGLGTQMFVRTASLTGNSSLTLAPRSDRVLQLGGAGSGLIR